MKQAASIDTDSLRRCIRSLETALGEIETPRDGTDDVLHDVLRAACFQKFDLVLEQSGKLLRKRLAAFFASNRRADLLDFRDLFRHAARHGLMKPEAAERWLGYRTNSDHTGYNEDEDVAEATLKRLPVFVADAKALADMIEAANDA